MKPFTIQLLFFDFFDEPIQDPLIKYEKQFYVDAVYRFDSKQYFNDNLEYDVVDKHILSCNLILFTDVSYGYMSSSPTFEASGYAFSEFTDRCIYVDLVAEYHLKNKEQTQPFGDIGYYFRAITYIKNMKATMQTPHDWEKIHWLNKQERQLMPEISGRLKRFAPALNNICKGASS